MAERIIPIEGTIMFRDDGGMVVPLRATGKCLVFRRPPDVKPQDPFEVEDIQAFGKASEISVPKDFQLTEQPLPPVQSGVTFTFPHRDKEH